MGWHWRGGRLIMILYVSSIDYINQFDRVISKDEVVRKFSGEFSANELLLKDFAKMEHFEKIILDINAFTDMEDEFISVLENYKIISDSRIIIYAPMLNSNSPLLQKLIHKEIYDIIIEEDYEAFKMYAERVIEEGNTKEDALKLLGIELEPEIKGNTEYSFINFGTQISVSGLGRLVGTTTVALNMGYNLMKKGAKVAVIFFEKDEKLKDVAEYYNIGYYNRNDKKELFYRKEELLLLSSSVPISTELDDCNFIILDVGELTEEKKSVFAKSKKNFIVSYSKKKDIEKVQSFLAETKEDIILLMRSAEEEKQANIRTRFSKRETYFLEYAPSYMDEKANNEIYLNTLSEYIMKKKVD